MSTQVLNHLCACHLKQIITKQQHAMVNIVSVIKEEVVCRY